MPELIKVQECHLSNYAKKAMEPPHSLMKPFLPRQ